MESKRRNEEFEVDPKVIETLPSVQVPPGSFNFRGNVELRGRGYDIPAPNRGGYGNAVWENTQHLE
ncbi:hypothetical protein F444_19002 [Phytophthora nicotianae P1976]|uniref:Uncharacterized protein n=1 Tax=Phytophthora nicotianae P1976 TaxID=1317066 RepID=A0A080Z9D2_PHYNI|nr:hypothetical protein F444_19002 [Phytophthora nicotianae P1976]